MGCYDQLCCPACPKLLLGLDLGLGCDKMNLFKISDDSLMSKTSFFQGLEIVDIVKSFKILQSTRNSDIFKNFFQHLTLHLLDVIQSICS